eukprot:UN01970
MLLSQAQKFAYFDNLYDQYVLYGLKPEEIRAYLLPYMPKPWTLPNSIVLHHKKYITHQVYNLRNHLRTSQQIQITLDLADQYAASRQQYAEVLHREWGRTLQVAQEEAMQALPTPDLIPRDQRPENRTIPPPQPDITIQQPPPSQQPQQQHQYKHFTQPIQQQQQQQKLITPHPFEKPQQRTIHIPLPMYHPIVPLPNLTTLVNIQQRAGWALQYTSIPHKKEFGNVFNRDDRLQQPTRLDRVPDFDPSKYAKNVAYNRTY